MIKNEDIENSIEKKKNTKTEEMSGIIESKKAKSNKSELITGFIPSKNDIPVFDNPIDEILYKINRYALNVNKLDHYGNAIPLGAFCFSISFFMNGLFEVGAHKNPDKYLYIILLLFGGCGQIIAGILEYIKGRTFSSNLYLIYGIYFVTFFLMKYPFQSRQYDPEECYKFFYGSWAGLTFPLIIGSFHVNLFYVIQTIVGCAFFVVRCIGECKDISVMKGIISGILEIIIGVASFYICINQIINDTLGFRLLPAISLQQDNDIDIDVVPENGAVKEEEKENSE